MQETTMTKCTYCGAEENQDHEKDCASRKAFDEAAWNEYLKQEEADKPIENPEFPPITLTYEQYESLHAEGESSRLCLHYTELALEKLRKAAQAIIDNRDLIAEDNKLQDFIEELYEVVPCSDCLQAPCVCDAAERDYERKLSGY
jgi:hypothetical protein